MQEKKKVSVTQMFLGGDDGPGFEILILVLEVSRLASVQVS